VQRQPPPYLQIAAHFRDQIKRGQLQDGDRLPSVRQIVTQWDVAHATAAKALTILRTEGLVTTIPGGAGGTIVSLGQVGNSPQDRLNAIRRWGKIYPHDEHARIVSASVVDAPQHVAEALGVDEGTPVIRRHRVTYRGDNEPVSASTSWFRGDLVDVAPALLQTDRIQLGTPGYIEQQTRRRMSRGRDQVTVGIADATAAAELGVPEGAGVLLGRNWAFDEAGDVIEFGEYTAVPGRWSTYEYEIG